MGWAVDMLHAWGGIQQCSCARVAGVLRCTPFSRPFLPTCPVAYGCMQARLPWSPAWKSCRRFFPPWLGTEHLKTENCVYSPPPGLAPRRL